MWSSLKLTQSWSGRCMVDDEPLLHVGRMPRPRLDARHLLAAHSRAPNRTRARTTRAHSAGAAPPPMLSQVASACAPHTAFTLMRASTRVCTCHWPTCATMRFKPHCVAFETTGTNGRPFATQVHDENMRRVVPGDVSACDHKTMLPKAARVHVCPTAVGYTVRCS